MLSGETESGCKGTMIQINKRKKARFRIYSEFTITESINNQAIAKYRQRVIRIIFMTIVSAFYQTLWNCLPRQTTFSTCYCGSL